MSLYVYSFYVHLKSFKHPHSLILCEKRPLMMTPTTVVLSALIPVSGAQHVTFSNIDNELQLIFFKWPPACQKPFFATAIVAGTAGKQEQIKFNYHLNLPDLLSRIRTC